jgi:RhtB (resistance to homoserine/threonine) family protein
MPQSPIFLLASIAAIHLLAVASPGPSFLLVSRAAALKSRAQGIMTGLGVTSVALFWAIAASLGVDALIAQAPWAFDLMQIAGGAYLTWIAIQSFRHADAKPAPAEPILGASSGTLWAAYLNGVKGSLANPKIIVFFGSIFVALFSPATPDWVRIAAVGIVGINEFSWYAFVAFAFSARRVQDFYRRAKAWIERAMGTFIGFFGIRLVVGGLMRFAG